MARLIAKPPVEDGLPLEVGGVRLWAPDPGCITSLAPFDGAEAALSKALKKAHGMDFPAPNRATGKAGARCVWSGRGQAFLIGPAPDAGLAAHAALTDQGDGWAMLRLEGARAAEVLARLMPLDLREAVFAEGHSARTQLGHLTVSITRAGAGFDLLVFRSMARTALHELHTAMKSVAAQVSG
ncbi:MAG: sarcosine oxidase subunit gamma [Paracoccaceae bacterium]